MQNLEELIKRARTHTRTPMDPSFSRSPHWPLPLATTPCTLSLQSLNQRVQGVVMKGGGGGVE